MEVPSSTNLLSPIRIAKIIILLLGVIILGVGLHSHFQSAWNKTERFEADTGHWVEVKPYEICSLKKFVAPLKDVKCPNISLERYFVSMIIISFLVSLAGFIVGFVMDLTSHPFKLVDAGVYGVLAFLLLVAGCVYIQSAVQIHNVVNALLSPVDAAAMKTLGKHLYKSEKIAAGCLTIIQSILYGAVAFLVARY